MMRDFSLAEAARLMRRTAPYVLLRCAVFITIFIAAMLLSLCGALLAWSLAAATGAQAPAAAMAPGAILGLVACLGLLSALRPSLLYLVNGGHLALMSALLDDEAIPRGWAQIGDAADRVAGRYSSARSLRRLDRASIETIQTVTGLVQGVLARILPIQRLRGARRLQRAYLNRAVARIDEVIIAQTLRGKIENPWTSARLALVLYAQTAKPMLVTAARLLVPVWLIQIALFVLALSPAAFVAALIPGDWMLEQVVFALLLVWVVKAALIDPLVLACLLQTYLRLTDSARPNPDWEDKLDTVSEAFRDMSHAATNWTAPLQRRAPSATPSHPGNAQNG